MRSHLREQVNRKVSHFLLGEEGKVGSQSAFTAAAFIGATSLAGLLLATPKADAAGWCGGEMDCHPNDPCCGCWDEGLNRDFEMCAQGTYDCKGPWYVPTPGVSCWTKP